jgi:hypothetical protein
MPTLIRLLLLSACLLGAPLVVMADESPADTNKIKSLSPEQAQKLVETFNGNDLYLNGLTALDADTAKALAEFTGQELSMADQANEAFFKNNPFTLETALAWAAVSGGNLAITAFDTPDSVAIAQVLSTRKGPLTLRNLKKISPKTLSALIEKRDVQIPIIETLELIQEPDGSVTEDFVIPGWLEERQKIQRLQQAE